MSKELEYEVDGGGIAAPKPHQGSAHRKAWHARRRMLSAAAPAGLITAGLFGIMTGLVQVDEVELKEGEFRELDTIVYEKPDDPEIRVVDRDPFEPLEITPPPPMPEINSPAGELMPIPVVMTGAVPDRIPLGSIIATMTGPQPIGTRIATPVRPPLPVYPDVAARRGLEGDCKVNFDISPRGTPFNIVATCTHSVFESEARRSVGKAEFLPQIADGHPVESHGAMYPLEFRLNSE